LGGGALRKKTARAGERGRERKNWFVCVIVGRGDVASRRVQGLLTFALERWRSDGKGAGSMDLKCFPGCRMHGDLRRVGRLPLTC
jgi:hypothetical protein